MKETPPFLSNAFASPALNLGLSIMTLAFWPSGPSRSCLIVGACYFSFASIVVDVCLVWKDGAQRFCTASKNCELIALRLGMLQMHSIFNKSNVTKVDNNQRRTCVVAAYQVIIEAILPLIRIRWQQALSNRGAVVVAVYSFRLRLFDE